MGSLVPGLPPTPWTVASEDPPDTETIAEYAGEWEPLREVVFYGPSKPQWLRDEPAIRPSTLRLRRFHDVVVVPHHVMLSYRDGRLLPVSHALGSRGSLLSPGVDDPFAPQHFNAMRCADEPARMDAPCFLAEGGWDHFGHALLEVIPKFALRSAAPDDLHFVSSERHVTAFLDLISVDPERFAIFRGPLFCKTLYIADPPVDLTGNFHSLARQWYADIARSVGAGKVHQGRKIFLSRSEMSLRTLSKEAEVEDLFRRHGFEIIHPQHLSLTEQIRVMASAEFVAGAGGSAMHSLVFAHAETRALIICSDQWLAPIDRYISKQDGNLGYVLGTAEQQEVGNRREWPFAVDLGLVERAIHEHFGL